jgi:hypothetical protein
MTTDNEFFNTSLSKARVSVEHCIGILKGKFQSLRGLRLAIRDEGDLTRASLWIRSCVVLHNILLEDSMQEKWEEQNIEIPMQDQIESSEICTGALDRRDHIKRIVLHRKYNSIN